MATREKKARSVTADSPTPSLGSANSGSNSNISAPSVATPITTTNINSDSAPTTPTSTRKGTGTGGAATGSNTGGSGGSSSTSSSNTRGSLSRLKSKQLQQNAGDEPSSTVEDTDSIVTTPSSRTTRGGGVLVREDSAGRDSPASTTTTTLASKDKEDVAASSSISNTTSAASKDLKKTSPSVVVRRATASKSVASVAKATSERRKNRVVTLKRTTLLKRKGKKIIGKPMLGRKAVARRQLVAVAKASAGTRKKEPISPTTTTTTTTAASKDKRTEDEEVQNSSPPSLRNGKPRNSDSPVAKRKSVAMVKSDNGSSKSPDSSLLGAIKSERRRSGSVSKCSDVTVEDGETATSVDIKRELLDYESRSKMLDKMAEAFNERKTGGGAASPVTKDDKGGSSSGGGTLRRSMRQRKSTARDKDNFASPCGKTGLEIKLEPLEFSGDTLETMSMVDGTENVTSSVAAPLTIDTTELEVPVGTEAALHSDGGPSASTVGSGPSSAVGGARVGGGAGEELAVGKDPSLSPGELVSEGVSEQSVKECYGEPAFLENNLGIEKDPKLGEIVQQERFRCDKVSDECGGANVEEEKETDAKIVGEGAGGGDEDDVVVVVVPKEEQEEEEEEDVVIVEEASDEANEKREEPEERKDSKDDKTLNAVQEKTVQEDKEEDEKFEDASSRVGDEEDVLMQESEVTHNDKDSSNSMVVEDEKIEIADNEEVAAIGKSSPVPESSSVVVANKHEDTAMELDDSSLQPDEPKLEQKDSPKPLKVDDTDGVIISSSPAIAADEAELSNGSSTKIAESITIDKRLASSSPSSCADVAETTFKTNCEQANGTAMTTASSTSDQSTPNQQTALLPRVQQQQKAGTGTITPKPVKPSLSTTGTVSGSGNGKEGKPKTRIPKEKSKEDEKTREEKLRQEKLRVEEKVREEKQRAERLEAEKRLKEEQQQQLQQRRKEGSMSAQENGLEEEDVEEVSIVAVNSPSATITGSKSGGSSPSQSATTTTNTADKENKTEPIMVAALHSLGGLNLPSITIAITKKDTGSGSSDESSQRQHSELEILPIKVDVPAGSPPQPPPAVVLLSKEEKPAKDGVATGATAPSLADTAESRLRISSKSEKVAAAVTSLTDRKDGGNKSPPALSIIKIENSNGSPVTVTESDATTVEEPKPAPTPVLRLLDESDDAAKRKESHLKHLGLLTIQAASEEKLRRAEQKPPQPDSDGAGGGSFAKSDGGAGSGGEGWLSTPHTTNQSGSSGSRSSTSGNKSTRSSKDEYTVSMKTVLKGSGSGGGSGSRGEKRKQQRMPLKMTFQKGKGKGKTSTGSGSGTVGRDSSNGSGSTSSNGSGYATDTGNNGDTTYYTVHSNELDHHSSNSSDGHSHRESGGAGGRKTHSRSHTTDGVILTEVAGESVAKEVIQKALVIPEKASSFNVHPERLCWDQCSYCGGKFGLYDTPCHVAAMKSVERQQKIILATLPKITLDSCLCDACYRHVDRKANCPPQKKKSQTSSTFSSGSTATTNTTNHTVTAQTTVSPIVLKVTTNKDGSTSIATEQQQQQQLQQQPTTAQRDQDGAEIVRVREVCAVRHCVEHGMQPIRRKWMVKMKRKIGKHLDINLEQAAKSSDEFISICNKHYAEINHLMVCAICTKSVQRNQVYYMYNNIPQLERLIQEQGISLRLTSSELVVCKFCKYYANLLVKPPLAAKKVQFVKDYSRRLYSIRQRAADLQQESCCGEQDVEQLQGMPAASVSVVPPLRPVDIVISDGEEEPTEAEDVEMSTEPQQQQEQQSYQMLGEVFSIGDSSVSVRRRVSNRKSPEVTIVENNNGSSQMGELGEITIIPTSKSLSGSTSNSNHQRDDNIDMTQVLKSNPNISMRELFPGEEELGVHVNIPFSASSVRTPEGWTKVTSTIQYDDSTRALWEELQKPYGNQSSFLRHLILLEKYFRNGDLVLSPQAKNNATTYSEAVQNRLRSYDNVPSTFPVSPPALASLTPGTTVGPSASSTAGVDKTSTIFQQFSSATITIVPASKARPKAASTATSSLSNNATAAAGTPISPTAAPVSLLKSNNLHLANSGESSGRNSQKRKLSNEGGRVAAGGNVSFGANSGGAAKVGRMDDLKHPLSSPPELISISNRKSSVTITSIPPQPGQSTSAVSTPAAKQLSLLNQSPQQSLLQPTPNQTKKSPAAAATAAPVLAGGSSTIVTLTNNTSTNAVGTGTAQREIIRMPEHLTEAERRETLAGRPWRPTLLPYEPENPDETKTSPLYQTADGRLLPEMVQVMSGGKAYHITIGDYNRMCILRREKLLQQQQNMIHANNNTTGNNAIRRQSLPQPQPKPSTSAAAVSPTALRLVTTSTENSLINNASTSSASAAARLVQFPNQLLEQNSLIPILGGGGGGAGVANKIASNAAPKSSLMVTMTTTVNNNNLAKMAAVQGGQPVPPPPAMKSLSLPNSTSVYPMMISANTISLPSTMSTATSSSSSSSASFTNHASSSNLNSSSSRPSTSGTTSFVIGQPTSLNPFDQLLKGGNMVTQAQLHEFMAAATAANGGGSGASALMDSSPAQLLSKIPKSLTVIPQQKQRSMSRVSSHEDQNSA